MEEKVKNNDKSDDEINKESQVKTYKLESKEY